MTRRVAPFTLLSALVLAVTCCGVGVDRGVDRVDADDVPFGLLDEDRDAVAAPGPGTPSVVEVYLYSEEAERLVRVQRPIISTSVPSLLAQLETGPTDAEADAGLRSALSDTDAIASVDVEGGIAVVDLAETFQELGGGDQLVAIAQLVFTATGRPDVDEVTLTLEGETVEVPRGDGSLTSGSLERADYESLSPSG